MNRILGKKTTIDSENKGEIKLAIWSSGEVFEKFEKEIKCILNQDDLVIIHSKKFDSVDEICLRKDSKSIFVNSNFKLDQFSTEITYIFGDDKSHDEEELINFCKYVSILNPNIHFIFDLFFDKYEFQEFKDYQNLKSYSIFLKNNFKYKDVSIGKIQYKDKTLIELVVIFKSQNEFESMKIIECKEGIPILRSDESETKEFQKMNISEMTFKSSSESEFNFNKKKKIDKIFFDEFGISLENEILNESKFEIREYHCSKDLIILKNEYYSIKDSIKNEMIHLAISEIKQRNFQQFLNKKEEKKEKVFEYFIPNVNQNKYDKLSIID
eukprot:gene936-9844_t